jgi:hypothetical protein
VTFPNTGARRRNLPCTYSDRSSALARRITLVLRGADARHCSSWFFGQRLGLPIGTSQQFEEACHIRLHRLLQLSDIGVTGVAQRSLPKSAPKSVERRAETRGARVSGNVTRASLGNGAHPRLRRSPELHAPGLRATGQPCRNDSVSPRPDGEFPDNRGFDAMPRSWCWSLRLRRYPSHFPHPVCPSPRLHRDGRLHLRP